MTFNNIQEKKNVASALCMHKLISIPREVNIHSMLFLIPYDQASKIKP